MKFDNLISKMTQAIVRGNGREASECFALNGAYHDVFYGVFRRPDIPDMVEKYFHRDASNFIWDIFDPVSVGSIGYARYVFSYSSTLPQAKDRRATFEGVAICRLEEGRIREYREVANAVTGLHLLGFSPERLSRFVDREAKALLRRAGGDTPQSK